MTHHEFSLPTRTFLHNLQILHDSPHLSFPKASHSAFLSFIHEHANVIFEEMRGLQSLKGTIFEREENCDPSQPLFIEKLIDFIQGRLLQHETQDHNMEELLEEYFPEDWDAESDEEDGEMRDEEYREAFNNSAAMNPHNDSESHHGHAHFHHHHTSAVPNHFTTRTFVLIYALYIKHSPNATLHPKIPTLIHQMIEMAQYQMIVIEFLCTNAELCKDFWVQYGQRLFEECIQSLSIYHQQLSVPMFWIGNKVHKLEWDPRKHSATVHEQLNFLFMLMDCAFPSKDAPKNYAQDEQPRYDTTDDFLDSYVYPNIESDIQNDTANIESLWKTRGEPFVLDALLSAASPPVCVDILQVTQSASLGTEVPFAAVHQLLSPNAPISHHLNALRCLQTWDFSHDQSGCAKRILKLWNDALYHQASIYSPYIEQLLHKPDTENNVLTASKAHFDEQYIMECIQSVAFQLDCASLNNPTVLNLKQVETLVYCTIELFMHSRYKVVMCTFQMVCNQLKKGNAQLTELLEDRVRPLLVRKAPHLTESSLFLLCIETLYYSAQNDFDREQFAQLLHESLFNMNWEMRETVFTFLFENGLYERKSHSEHAQQMHQQLGAWLPNTVQQRLKNDPNTAVRFAALRCVNPQTLEDGHLEMILECIQTEKGGDPFLRQQVFEELFCSEQWLSAIEKHASKENVTALMLHLLVHIYNGFEYDTMIAVTKFILRLEFSVELLQHVIFGCRGDSVLFEILENAFFSELLLRGELIAFLRRISLKVNLSHHPQIEQWLSMHKDNSEITTSEDVNDVQLFFNHTQDQDCYD